MHRISFICTSIDNDDINELAVTPDVSPPNSSSTQNNNHHGLPSQDILDSFDYNTDSDSTHSAGNPLRKDTPPFSNSAPDLHELKKDKGHRRTGSKLGLVDDLKYGERKNPNLVRIEVPLGKPIEEVYEGVHDGDVLGSGVSGIVRNVTHRATQVQYAVKCLDLALIDSDAGLRQLKEEIYIMCQLVSIVLEGERVERCVCVVLSSLLSDYVAVDIVSSLRSVCVLILRLCAA